MTKPKKPQDILMMAGLRLKAVRLTLGFDRQDSFAAKLGCTTTRYNNWEVGARFPAPEVTVRLLQLFGIGPDFIYGGSMRGIPYELSDSLEQHCAELGAVIHAPTAEWPAKVARSSRPRLPGAVPNLRPKPGKTFHEDENGHNEI